MSSSASLATPTPAPLDYPVEGVQYTALSASQHMWTHFLITADGTVVAWTRVKEDTLFGGFHGAATISLYSAYSTALPLTQVSSPIIGVSGTVWGHSDVSHTWITHIDSVSLPRLRYYAVVQLWEPQWLTVINDAAKFAAAAAKVIEPLLAAGKAIAGK